MPRIFEENNYFFDHYLSIFHKIGHQKNADTELKFKMTLWYTSGSKAMKLFETFK